VLLALILARLLAAAPAGPASGALVLVAGGPWHGTGIVWAPGRVLTALHVVEDMPDVTVTQPGGAPRRAVVVDREAALDLALLAVDGPLGEPLPLGAAARLAAGERVTVAGCPARTCAGGPGKVLEASRAFAGARYLALEADVRPGASGGPVLDARGALVGIVDLLVRSSGVALAVPAERAAARFPRAASP